MRFESGDYVTFHHFALYKRGRGTIYKMPILRPKRIPGYGVIIEGNT